MNEGDRLADAASGFLGVPFRLHGRDPRLGLDCVGLISASLEHMGRVPTVPTGYRLRNTCISQWLGHAKLSGMHEAHGPILRGDVLLCGLGKGQSHLMIAASPKTVIHAHSGLRRVVLQPLSASSKLIKRWRLSGRSLSDHT